EATADIETFEERANRLLDESVRQFKADKRYRLPLYSLRFVRRYASRERLAYTDASVLVRRSIGRYLLASAAAFAVLAGVLLVLLPLGIRYPILERMEMPDHFLRSSIDRRLFAQIEEGHVLVVSAGKTQFKRQILSVDAVDVLVSPT